MTSYSVADAKNTLDQLIDLALRGEAVVITTHCKPVVELKPSAPAVLASRASYIWLQSRRRQRPGVGMTSADILDHLHKAD